MMRIQILALLFTLASCGIRLIPKPDFVRVEGVSTKLHKSTATEFTSFVTYFESYGAKEFSDPNFKVGDIPINFGDPKNSSHDGVCLIYGDDTREVLIRKSWWDQADQISKKIMIFHELGHCRLDRRHNEETIDVNGKIYKLSIMHPVIPDPYDYGMHETGYLKELYTSSKESLLELFSAR